MSTSIDAYTKLSHSELVLRYLNTGHAHQIHQSDVLSNGFTFIVFIHEDNPNLRILLNNDPDIHILPRDHSDQLSEQQLNHFESFGSVSTLYDLKKAVYKINPNPRFYPDGH